MHHLLAFILLFLAAAPAAAQFERLNQPPTQARSNAITPELAVNARAVPGGRAELAIFMRVRPGWHGYWLNPGDAGLPMSVEWELPDGWSVGPLRYPVPHRLLVSGIVNYVFESDYAVLTTLAVPTGATGSQRIAAEMRWLACTETICVPEQGRVELVVPTGGIATPDTRFNAWRQALPRPMSSVAHFERSGDAVRIAVPLPASVAVAEPYFYPEADGAIDYSAEQRFGRDGDRLIAELKAGDDPPAEWRGVLAYGDGQGFEIRAIPGSVKGGGESIGGVARISLLTAILGALLGGLLLNLMPCVFPILAMKALHLARAGGDEREARRDALGYAAGAVIGTAGLGAILLLIRAGGSSAGWAFQLQDPRTTLLLLLLATAITLNLLRAFELPVLGGEASRVGSFGTGALAAFVATPCSGPFMGAALGAALLMPLWGSVAVFAALGLGLALPFVAVAFVPGLRRRLPKPGPWMARLQRFLAVPMAATVVACLWLIYRQAGDGALFDALVILFFFVAFIASYGAAQRGYFAHGWIWLGLLALLVPYSVFTFSANSTARSREIADGKRWSHEAVREAQAAGKPVFVYFTADWCLTCKANEAAAIDRSATIAAFREAGVTTLVGDWTNGDPAIGRFLESQGRAGVPLYLWYAPGAAQPEVLPQILTSSMLIERARARR